MDKSHQILKRLELLHPKKIDLSLFRLNKLLKKLGNPHLNLAPVIHVAGTNGKGSTVSFLESVLTRKKYRVGTFTSPHILRYNERIKINGVEIDDNSLIEKETSVLSVEKKIRGRVKNQMEKTQREYYLNEQLKAIQKELGEIDEGKDELSNLSKAIADAKMPKLAKEKCLSELKKLKSMSPMSAEATVVRN